MNLLTTKLRTPEFQDIRDKLHTDKPWLNFLISVFLAKLEEYLYDDIVNARVKEEVSTAVEQYHQEMNRIEPDFVTPVYQEKESGIEGFPEMSLTAPWYQPDGR